MTFYLKPPRGIIEYHVLQKCAEERLKFFTSTSDLPTNSMNTEYLITDSAFDRSGHFMLRLAALRDSAFANSFVDYEVTLFKVRLNNFNNLSIRKFLCKLLRHTNECVVDYGANEEVVTFLRCVLSVVTKMCSGSYRRHVLQDLHVSDDNCSLFTITVPYVHCTSLLYERQVRLRNGYAIVECEQWKDLLLSLFYTFLKISLVEMKHSRSTHAALNDHRIKSILNGIFSRDNHVRGHSLQNFDQEVTLFPLCMQNLQNVLEKHHRLPHEERYNYSLFLKDIGMSLEESLTFWKTEYSKDNLCGKCCHNWEKDEKRYIYSIRHLYGLEGSRKNYRSRNCHYFQNSSLAATQQGGCPFKHFDNENLKRILTSRLSLDDEMIDDILLERLNSASNACNLFLQISVRNILNTTASSVQFASPAQYFYSIKDLK